MQSSYRFILLICLALIAAGSRSQQTVQYSERAEEIFRDGVDLYSATMFREAISAFDRVIREYPSSQRVTAAYVMKGKAQYLVQENLESARTMRELISRFPQSAYLPDAELTLGLVYQRIGRPAEALQEYMNAWRAAPPAPPRRLLQEITAAFDTVLKTSGSVEEMQRLLQEMARPDGRAYLWRKLAEKGIAAGDVTMASLALDTLAARYGTFCDPETIAALRAQVSHGSNVKIGALMPLMQHSEPSAIKEIGKEVSDGIQYAFERYAEDPSVRIKVGLETRDTERDAKIAAKAAQELADDRSVIGLIGPVFSMNANAVAAVANARGIPTVTPTANANGIAATGGYIFQANPDYETRGAAMAQYAVTERGLRTLAVLAPSDTYGKFLAEGFIKKAGKLGANVLAVEWYQHGAADLKSQLADIRRKGMTLGAIPLLSFAGKLDPPTMMKFVDAGVPRRRLDSLVERRSVVPASFLLGENAQAKIDSFGIKVTYDQTKIDSLQYPVESIQAVYAPISSADEIGVVSSQVVYFNFHTQLLGSGEWDNIGELSRSSRYCRGVIFETDSYADTGNAAYAEFLRGYSARFKQSPTKNVLYGYDTAMLMLELIRKGATTRDALVRGLAGLSEYQGLHAKISFSSRRVSNWLTLLQFDDDHVTRIGEVHVDNQAP